MSTVSESDVAEAALRMALEQPYIPASPGHADESGRVLLCAAACFAAAGLEQAFGAVKRSAFEDSIARSADKSLVYAAFHRLGWSDESCKRKLEPNDASQPFERQQLMRRLVAETLTSVKDSCA
jgi:hypothetical protein